MDIARVWAVADDTTVLRPVRHGPTPHGTYNGYTNYRCRCERCRAANAAFERERKRRRKLTPDPALEAQAAEAVRLRIMVWQLVYEAGRAGRVADEIVRNRPVPVALLSAVFA